MADLTGFLYGAIGGGAATLLWKTLDRYLISVRLNESVAARKKLFRYAKPLWLDSRELWFRFRHIRRKLDGQDVRHGIEALQAIPDSSRPLQWYTKYGYYTTSTAYMIASVACWIRLYQHDVVFLNFGAKSATTEFFKLIEGLKRVLSSHGSILWYHYINGIGDRLVHPKKNVPLTIYEFTRELHTNPEFQDYFDQLFCFIARLAGGEFRPTLDEAIEALEHIGQFIEARGIAPALAEWDRPARDLEIPRNFSNHPSRP
jgi:hypothetical protein